MIFPSYKNYTSHINILKKEIKLGNKYATERMNESNNSSWKTHKLVKRILQNHYKTVCDKNKSRTEVTNFRSRRGDVTI